MGSYQSVDVYVKDSTPAESPVAGMMVRVFGTSGNFFTQDTTDADGHVGFTLWSQDYDLRFYQFGSQVTQPQRITVSETDPNVFDVQATVFEHPVAVDPRLCRASGYFRTIAGAPHRNVDIHFIGEFDPILLEGAAVLSERVAIRTDGDGYACIDLIRGANYLVTVQGYENCQRRISVPDLPSVNLPSLLFTVVEEITFYPAAPFSLSVGSSLELTPTVIGTNKVPLVGTASGDLLWSSSDETVFTVSVEPDYLVLLGIAAGTAELSAAPLDTSIISVPAVGIQGVPQTVTVA